MTPEEQLADLGVRIEDLSRRMEETAGAIDRQGVRTKDLMKDMMATLDDILELDHGMDK